MLGRRPFGESVAAQATFVVRRVWNTMTVRTTMMRAALLTVLAAVGIGVGAPAAIAATGATAAAPSLSQRNDLGSKRWMSTDATLSGTTLYAVTTTHAGERLRGYHGCVTVLFQNSVGAVLGQTAVQRYGVDGSAIGTNHRVVAWNNPVSAAIAANTTSLAIQHWRC
jgi:hypothetical protein